jgi:hypothetical protein
MNATDSETFDSWLGAYGHAWETRDPRAAAKLFSEKATYRETPCEKLLHGREAIAEYWSRVTRGHQGVRLDHEILAVTDEMGIARWRASFDSVQSEGRVELDGISVVGMGADGLCKEFREWWHYRERDVERG